MYKQSLRCLIACILTSTRHLFTNMHTISLYGISYVLDMNQGMVKDSNHMLGKEKPSLIPFVVHGNIYC